MSAQLAPIIGVSPAMKKAIALIERFAPTPLSIMLVGATGTGKELFAQHIHYASRRSGELVDVNCGALPQDLAESLLFGHRRGAFTGAVDSVTGHLQRADRGTLFLDEVLHLPVGAQVKLLRALETGEVQPLGAAPKRRVDLRVVSAAQEDTPERLDRGLFRSDLFQRLAGIVIDLPLLVERPEDIVPLAEHFAAALGQRLEAGCAHVLQDYGWPGNVRELRLVIERAGCLVKNGTLPPSVLRDAIELGLARELRSDRRRGDRREKRSDRRLKRRPRFTYAELLTTCEREEWNPERIAASLRVRRTTMYEELRIAGISLRGSRKVETSA